jgi:hypothetical protein
MPSLWFLPKPDGRNLLHQSLSLLPLQNSLKPKTTITGRESLIAYLNGNKGKSAYI